MMLQNEERDRCISYCDDILLLIEEYKGDYSRYYFQYLCNSCIVWIGQLIEELQQKEAESDLTELASTKKRIQKIWDEVTGTTPPEEGLSGEELNVAIEALGKEIANLKEHLSKTAFDTVAMPCT